MTAPTTPRGTGTERGRNRMLLLFAPGLLMAVVAVALWAWSTDDDALPTPAATTASAEPTPTPTSEPDPTPEPTPESTTSAPTEEPTEEPTGEPTEPPDRVRVDLGLMGQYIGDDDVRIVFTGMGEEGGEEYATLLLGSWPDGVTIGLFDGEPYELPDGRWLHLLGLSEDSVGLLITTEQDY